MNKPQPKRQVYAVIASGHWIEVTAVPDIIEEIAEADMGRLHKVYPNDPTHHQYNLFVSHLYDIDEVLAWINSLG